MNGEEEEFGERDRPEGVDGTLDSLSSFIVRGSETKEEVERRNNGMLRTAPLLGLAL